MDGFKSEGMSVVQKVLIGAVLVVLAVCIGLAVFFFMQYQNLKKNPNAEANAEVQKLVNQIKPYYDLPTDETPTVATVSDKSKVADQPFFAKAENGDKILIYRKNKLAILFRPSQNKIINVGPIDLDAATGGSTGSTGSNTAAVAKIGLYNSGNASGVTTTAESKLTGASYASKLSVAEKKNATVKAPGKIIVVDVSGTHADLASSIASTLGGTVGALPAGEPKPPVDVAVYLGN